MRIFKTSWFHRFSRRQNIADADLCKAVTRARNGLVDADLGGQLLKQRVARLGAGKSKGYRVILAYDRRARAVFLYGFAKKDRENIDERETEAFKDLARTLLQLKEHKLKQALTSGVLIEVICDGEP